MVHKIILNAEIAHLEFLNKNYLNGDVEILKIIFDYFKSNNKIVLIDIGHYESEQFTKELIFEYLS